jgi:Tfp pilus assembly protein PilN
VRAVNLIPGEVRRGGVRSGGSVYVLLGLLGVLVAGVAFNVLTNNTIADRRAQVDTLQEQVQAAQAQATQVQPYRDFAALAQARVETVRQLGASRFDWPRAFAGLSKVIPDNVWLTSLLGTVTPGVTVEGSASGTTSTLRSSITAPAIEMTGCTTNHDSVARLISRLRLMDGVQRVSLADSAKADQSASGGGGGSGDDCRHGHANFPQFDVVVFFDAPPALPTLAPATGTTGLAATAAAATGTSAPTTTTAAATTPAATTPAPSAPASSSPGGTVR